MKSFKIIFITVVCIVGLIAGALSVNEIFEVTENQKTKSEELQKQKETDEKEKQQQEFNKIAIERDEMIAQSRKDRMEATQYENSISPAKPPPEIQFNSLLDTSHFPVYSEKIPLQKKMDEDLESIRKIIEELKNYEKDSLLLQDSLEERLKNLELQESNIDSFKTQKPKISIHNENIEITVYDSKSNPYHWGIPISSFEDQVDRGTNFPKFVLELPNGSLVKVGDYTGYVGTSFKEVIDDVWDNSSSEEDFLYELWYITSRQIVYSEDIGEFPRIAIDTLARGGGDCEDLSILMADLIRSSSHTSQWRLGLIYFDTDNLQNPNTVNHVALEVHTGSNSFIIETTAQNEASLSIWANKEINGWRFPV